MISFSVVYKGLCLCLLWVPVCPHIQSPSVFALLVWLPAVGEEWGPDFIDPGRSNVLDGATWGALIDTNAGLTAQPHGKWDLWLTAASSTFKQTGEETLLCGTTLSMSEQETEKRSLTFMSAFDVNQSKYSRHWRATGRKLGVGASLLINCPTLRCSSWAATHAWMREWLARQGMHV